MSEDAGTDRARLDVWLWRARFFKTRALASSFIAGKGVRLERGGLPVRKIDKPGYDIAVGDRLAFAFGGRVHLIQIAAMGTRRGPPSEAAILYKTL
jgi:ribosome-associated heat shock protein Hsp15